MFFALLSMLSTSAHASAVAGCTFTGTVEAVKADRIAIAVQAVEPFGHSGPPPECPAVGAVVEFTPDGPIPPLLPGARVAATEMDAWSLTAAGANHSHSRGLSLLAPATPDHLPPVPTPE